MTGAGAWLESLPGGEDERAAIAHGNAERLLRLGPFRVRTARAGAPVTTPSRSGPSSGSLSGRITLVLGGAGNVGEGIVRAHLATGATVVVPSRAHVAAARARLPLMPTGAATR